MQKRIKSLSAGARRDLDGIHWHQMRTSHPQEGHVIFGMSLFCCPVFRGEAFDPHGGAPTGKSDACVTL